MTKPRTILFVALHDSPHACRWINSLDGRGWDLHLFPCSASPVLPMLRGVTIHRPFLRIGPGLMRDALRMPPRRWRHKLSDAESAVYPHRLPHEPIFAPPIPRRVEALVDRLLVRTGESAATVSALYGPRTLARLIRKLQPDLIHSMEFQHCGYNVLKARQLIGRTFPPWLATNWGSDIYHFQHDPGHRAQIQRLLGQIDFYSCECQRDVALARALGMTAKVLPVMANSGGFDLPATAHLRSLVPPSRRRRIMVKGYQHFAGRALTALAALERCADLVRDFEVVIFSAGEAVKARAAQLRAATPLRSITLLPRATHEEMLRMFALSRVYLGVSVADAISTSALEAMALGAFPIQTDTSCCDEWFEDGKGGYLIPPDDVEIIAARLRSALTDDHLVDQAAQINWRTVTSRLDQREVEQRVRNFYDQVFAAGQ